MKKFLSGLILGIIIASVSVGYSVSQIREAYYNPEIKLRVDGEYVDVTPITAVEEGQRNGFNLFPVRALGEALGYKVDYDVKTKVIDLDKPTIEDVAKAVVDSCVMIRTYKDNQYVAQGSGIIADGYIITNKHVLDQGTKYTVEYNDSTKQYDAERIVIDTVLDVGILKSPKQVKSVVLGNSDGAKQGEKIISISSPHELKNTISEGMIAAFRNVYGINYIQVSTNAYPGESGGGLFNMKGEVIAITKARLLNGEDLNLAIPINDIKKLLEEIK